MLLINVNASTQRMNVHNGVNVRGAKTGVFNTTRIIPQDKKDMHTPTNTNIFLYKFILYVNIEKSSNIINIIKQYDITVCVI